MDREWLKEMRINAGKTHEKIAELSGIERSYYTKIENGYPLSVKVAKKIAIVLGFQWTIFFDSNCDATAQNKGLG